MESKPHVIITVMIYVLATLSAAAGIPKILQLPQELGFLSAIGFSAIAVSVLGVVQLTGGVLLLWKRSRLSWAVLAGLALLVSSFAIFSGGNTKFGLISLLPLAVSIVVIYSTLRVVERGDA